MPRQITGQGNVEVDVDGKKYRGSYTLEGSRGHTISVTSTDFGGPKTTHVGSMPLDAIAKILLLQLVNEGLAKARLRT